MALDRLRASLAESPIVRFGDYEYFVHPITDGIPLGSPEVLDEVLSELVRMGDWNRCDKIVTVESMGFPLAAGLSTRVHKPYVFVRKRQYGLEGEVSLKQTTGYSKTDMFINNIRHGDRVVFVDDVISTGGAPLAVGEGKGAPRAGDAGQLLRVDENSAKGRMGEEPGDLLQTEPQNCA